MGGGVGGGLHGSKPSDAFVSVMAKLVEISMRCREQAKNKSSQSLPSAPVHTQLSPAWLGRGIRFSGSGGWRGGGENGGA